LGEAPHGSRVYRWNSRVYGQYTWQDHPMGSTDKYLAVLYVQKKAYV